MIKNRRELLAMAAEWTNMAKNDLRRQIVSFMEQMGTDEVELAHALGISDAELQQILNGNGEITLSTFAKILIATDNVLEIKPMAATQFGGYDGMPRPHGSHRPMGAPTAMPPVNRRRPMPRPDMMGGMMPPPPMFDENGEMLPPPMFGNPCNGQRFGGMPGMSGKFGKKPMPNPEMVRVPRTQLVETVLDNGWDDEIDLMNSTTNEIMEFLATKGITATPERFARPQSQVEMPVEARDEVEQPMAEQPSPSKLDAAIAKIAETLQNNPELMRTLEAYL